MALFPKSINIFNYQSDMSIKQASLQDCVNKEKINKEDMSIFYALCKDNNSIDGIFVWNKVSEYAKLDGDDKELSKNEILKLLKDLKDSKQTSLFDKGITPQSFIDFVNKYLLKKNSKLKQPEYIVLGEKLGVNINVSDGVSKEQYQNELIPALKQYTQDVNLYKTNSNETINNLNDVVDTYIQKYGTELRSTSREILLTGAITKQSSEAYDKVRAPRGEKKELSTEELILENNFANCGEAQNLILNILKEKYADKYEFKAFNIEYKTKQRVYPNKDTHCAVLVTDKNNEEYVIDMWINPQGGIYKKDDWEQKITEIFDVAQGEYKTYVKDEKNPKI